jgi:nitroimidazol reductase NimA-like FMN-containing flavoprotein (pyridoxamine 5'-phosphate oxidase superfamily)
VSRTELTRSAELRSDDRRELDALLDGQFLAHVGLVRPDGWPMVAPTLAARDGDQLLLHGSTGSRWMRELAAGAPACIEVTSVDGLVVARSAFESSIRYRSAVIFGVCRVLDGEEKLAALDLLTERVIPGRTGEVRRPTPKELAATMVLAMPIAEWSLKISDGWAEDPPADVAGEAWAGVVPLQPAAWGEPLPSPDLREGVVVPSSVADLVARPSSPPRRDADVGPNLSE